MNARTFTTTIAFACTLPLLAGCGAESEEALVRRLSQRKTEPEDQLKMRIATARQELKRLDLFDYVVINAEDELDKTCRKIAAIISAEHCRVKQREINL